MYLKSHHFDDIVSKELAGALATRANEILASKGKHVYGVLLKDGTVDYFSSHQERDDSHTALLIDVSEMGWSDDHREVHMETNKGKDMPDFWKSRAKQLERDLNLSREKKGE